MATTTAHGTSSVNGAQSVAPADELRFRRALPLDAEGIMFLLLEKFYPEHRIGKRQLRLDLSKVVQTITNQLETGTTFIAEIGGEVVGTLGLYTMAPWWSDEYTLVDQWFYVAPEVRHRGVARRLLAMAKDFAAASRLPLIVGVYNSHDAERKDAFFIRQGFEPLGGWYIMDGGQ